MRPSHPHSQSQSQPHQQHPHHHLPSKIRAHSHRSTHPLIWLAAILCTLISLAVIVAGIVVFIGYIVIHPRIPVISVIHANLDNFLYDQPGILQTQITIVVRFKNGNHMAHASFSATQFKLSFEGMAINVLRADPFDVKKNSSVEFNYLAESDAIPLDPEQQEVVDTSLKDDRVAFGLKGSSQTQWRVGLLGSVKFSCHLNCELKFHTSNHTWIPSRCSSKAK